MNLKYLAALLLSMYCQKYWQNDDEFKEKPKYFGDTFDCRCDHPTEKSEQEQDRGKGAVVD